MSLLIVIGVALLVFLGSARSQTDCVYPTDSDVVSIIQSAIVSSDATMTPVITIIDDIHLVCLAHSRVRGRYRSFSVLVNYTCTGNAGCVGGANDAVPTVEQFESDCRQQSGEWSNRVLGQTSLRRTQGPVANFSTILREDCTSCASPGRADASRAPISDDDNHCISCDSCEKLNRCFGFQEEQCCNVYLPDGTCGLECPGGSTETPEFECVINCGSRGNVTNGRVNYSMAPTNDGTYSLGTVASVECMTGHKSEGAEDAVCTNGGTWSIDLANCNLINCGSRGNVTNGRVNYSMAPTNDGTYSLGTVASVECMTGHKSEGAEDAVCTNNGTWSIDLANCNSVCRAPLAPSGVIIEEYSSTEEGAVIQFHCQNGYHPTEWVTSQCINSSWSPDPLMMVCVEQIPSAVCRAPLAPSGVIIEEYSSTEEGAVIQFHCQNGYHPTEWVTSQCINSSWSPDPLMMVCVEQILSSPVLPESTGTVTPVAYKNDHSVTIVVGVVCSVVFLSVGALLGVMGLYLVLRMRRKISSSSPSSPLPPPANYEEMGVVREGKC